MKRNGFLALIGVAGLGGLLLASTPVQAGDVNCGIIKKDLANGRTPEEIAEMKMTSVEEVKKCAAEDAGKPAAAAPAAAEKAAEEKKPAQ